MYVCNEGIHVPAPLSSTGSSQRKTKEIATALPETEPGRKEWQTPKHTVEVLDGRGGGSIHIRKTERGEERKTHQTAMKDSS